VPSCTLLGGRGQFSCAFIFICMIFTASVRNILDIRWYNLGKITASLGNPIYARKEIAEDYFSWLNYCGFCVEGVRFEFWSTE
jgi:hypothetical protein